VIGLTAALHNSRESVLGWVLAPVESYQPALGIYQGWLLSRWFATV